MMSEGQIGCENQPHSEKFFVLTEGKYLKARTSKDNGGEIKLYAVDSQFEEESGFRFIRESNNIKYVAFHFIYGETCYSPKVEGETLKLEKQSCNLQDSDENHFTCSTDLCWFEMENIGGNEQHYLKAEKNLYLSFGSEPKQPLRLSKNESTKITAEESTYS
ncbi:hypothetical protein ATANTOWER_013152 [Ataeniobius toweri]|uniref:Uncharacterized protein n=1 Tax=Ataeniobius toweri TaxID=208326 RepID=A0ABU7CJR5_9TELE|nr:hypothetical protein [Ataeniobius toweri]